jgi:hypothetical protein
MMREVQAPTTVVTITKARVIQNRVVVVTKNDNPYQMSNARNAPAVPGAPGQNPVPNPVDKIT